MSGIDVSHRSHPRLQRPARLDRRGGLMRSFHAIPIAVLLLVGGPLAGLARAQSPPPCAPVRFEGASYTVCTFDVRRDDIRINWKGADGRAYGGFSSLAEALRARGRQLRFAMNGGMFETDLSPVGLFI